MQLEVNSLKLPFVFTNRAAIESRPGSGAATPAPMVRYPSWKKKKCGSITCVKRAATTRHSGSSFI